MNFFEEVKRELFEYNNLGEEIQIDGTLLIGRAHHIAPLAWLHSIYAPISPEEVNHLEKEMDKNIPKSYSYFLTNCCNGLKIFNDALSLDGLRKKNGRSIEASRQPYSIITPNTIERPFDAKDEYLFIGGYSWGNGALIYIDKSNEKVYKCERQNTNPIQIWTSFEEMLITEIKRLKSLHDIYGKKVV